MCSHLATYVHGFGIGTPWPAQVNFFRCRIRNEFTIEKYKSIFLSGSGRCCSDKGIHQAFNCTVVEHSDRFTKNKVRSAFDKTILIILTASFSSSVQAILVAEDPAIP